MASADPGSFNEPGSHPEELMTLPYGRLAPFLLAGLKALAERVAQLEQR